MDQSNLPQDIQRFQEEEKERLAQRLADLLGINYFNLQYFKPETEALTLISEENARRLKIIPIKKEYKKLYIGVFDPTNEEVQKFLESLKESGYEPIIGVISETSFEEGLKFYQLLAKEKFSYRESLEIRPEVIKEV